MNQIKEKQHITDKQREAFLLYKRGLNFREIAEKIDIHESTARERVRTIEHKISQVEELKQEARQVEEN
jgi:DNA-directed RNA polymerase specialized sigma24 family protein